MTPVERAALIEAVTSAHRERDPHGRVLGHRSFHDLDADARREAYEQTCLSRALEAALDAEGLSSTARAVLRRIEASS
jgi:hypothetical protein